VANGVPDLEHGSWRVHLAGIIRREGSGETKPDYLTEWAGPILRR
jgi:hypothetical protein